jgi:hypothetical protein
MRGLLHVDSVQHLNFHSVVHDTRREHEHTQQRKHHVDEGCSVDFRERSAAAAPPILMPAYGPVRGQKPREVAREWERICS